MMLAPHYRFLLVLCVALGLFAGDGRLSAQTEHQLRDGSFEAGVLIGDTIGGLVPAVVPLPSFNGFEVKSPGKGVLGASVAIAANPTLLFYGEVSVFRGEHRNRPLEGGYSAQTNLLNLVYEGGFEKIFPLSYRVPATKPANASPAAQTAGGSGNRTVRFALYALGAGSAIQKRADTLVTYVDPNPQPDPKDVLAGATRVRLKHTVFAPVIGGGLRYYFGKRFVYRIETKLYLPTGDVPRATGVASMGVFVDLP